jgi:hypothetical protein
MERPFAGFQPRANNPILPPREQGRATVIALPEEPVRTAVSGEGLVHPVRELELYHMARRT